MPKHLLTVLLDLLALESAVVELIVVGMAAEERQKKRINYTFAVGAIETTIL